MKRKHTNACTDAKSACKHVLFADLVMGIGPLCLVALLTFIQLRTAIPQIVLNGTWHVGSRICVNVTANFSNCSSGANRFLLCNVVRCGMIQDIHCWPPEWNVSIINIGALEDALLVTRIDLHVMAATGSLNGTEISCITAQCSAPLVYTVSSAEGTVVQPTPESRQSTNVISDTTPRTSTAGSSVSNHVTYQDSQVQVFNSESSIAYVSQLCRVICAISAFLLFC